MGLLKLLENTTIHMYVYKQIDERKASHFREASQEELRLALGLRRLPSARRM